MRRVLLFSAFVVCLSTNAKAQSPKPAMNAPAARPAATASPSPAAVQAARASFAKLPLSFEENVGQTDGRVKYMSRGSGYNLFLTADQAVFALRDGSALPNCTGLSRKIAQDCTHPSNQRNQESVLWLKMVGANPSAKILGSDLLPGKINYYVGNDPSKWRTGVRQFGRVSYQGIYPGVDLTYYGNQQQLESDFIVAPGSNPRSIQFEVTGARETRIDAQGNLILGSEAGDVRLLRPVVYQVIQGSKQDVSGRYVLLAENRVGFEIGKYDAHEPLVIDPTFVYSTYLGGATLFSGGDQGLAVAIDAAGAAYVTGMGGSSDFPGSALSGPVAQSTPFAFVTKFDPTGSSLVYSTLLRGTTGFSDSGNGIGVDSSGNAYVDGITADSDFPLLNPFQATIGDVFSAGTFNFIQSGFVAGLAGDGTLIYSTYFGGRNNSDQTTLNGLAADGSGNAYVVGNTNSQNFPTVNPFQATQNSTFGGQNVVVAKFNPQGQPIYSTYLGGGGSEIGDAIAIDGNGNAYVTGQTSSNAMIETGFPVQSAPVPFQGAINGSANAFVAKFTFASPTLTLDKSTYLGGGNTDEGFGIAVDNATPPNVYVTGQTNSKTGTPFPTKNPIFGPSAGTFSEAFVTKLKGDFTALIYSTFLGGTGSAVSFTGDTGNAIDLDGANPPNAFVTGSTPSTDFPVASPLQSTIGPLATSNAFVTEINGAGSALTYSTYLGGRGSDKGLGIAVDSAGNAYITGTATSPNFPVVGSGGTAPYQGELRTSAGNAFLTKISSAAAPVALNFFPPSFNFHSVGVGQASAPESVTLSNNTVSAVTINVGGITFTGANGGDFSQTNTCPASPATLGAGASCTISVVFNPSLQDGRTAQLSVASSAAPAAMNLSGFGAVPEVSFSQTTINFGTNDPLHVGVTNFLSITNKGGAPLHVGNVEITGADAAAFAITFNGCTAAVAANGGSCFIEPTFTPTTAGHAYSATLLINDDAAGSPQSISMSGTGAAQVIVSPHTLEYGGWLVGTSSFDNSISLLNGTAGNITLTSITPGGGSGDFPIDPNNGTTCVANLVLLPGVSCNLEVFFKPTVGSAFDGRTATYTFNWTGAASGSQAVTVMGTGETGFTLYQNSYTAPSEFVGATESRTNFDQVFNGNAFPVTVSSIVITGATPQDFVVQLDTSCSTNGVVAANSVCFLDGSFSPSAVGTRSATVTINYTPPGGSSLILNVTGTGLAGPVVFPATYDMGTQIVGITGPTQRVVLQNVQKAQLAISAVTPPAGTEFAIASSSTCKSGVNVPGGGNCFFDLTFKPGATGSRTASVVVTDNGPGSPRTLNLTGAGEPAADTVSVSPNALDFGNVVLVVPSSAQPTVSETFYLINAGAASTTISIAPAVTTAGTPFALATGGAAGTCVLNKVVLPQGGACTVVVTFKPTGTGLQTNSITLTDSVGGLHTISIQGTGVNQGVMSFGSAPTFTQLPSTTTATPLTATLTNSGSGPLTINSLYLTGANATDFAIVPGQTTCAPGTTGMTIPAAPGPGNTCVVALTFTAPSTVGTYKANVSVSADLGNNVKGSTSTNLTGNVVAGGLSASPNPIDFGTVALGNTITYSSLHSFNSITVTNNNPATVTITSVAPQTGVDFTVTDNNCLTTLQPPAQFSSTNTCTFDVTFAPTVNGPEPTNKIVVTYNVTGGASGQQFLIPLTGAGSNALVAMPNPLNISAAVGGFGGNPTITIGNGSASTINITAVGAITGPGAANFAISFEFCTGTALQPTGSAFGTTCQISLNFNPTAPGTNVAAQIPVSYNIGGGATQTLTVNLSGSATAAQVTITPTQTPPTPLIFGAQTLNTQSLVLSVLVTNSGNDVLNISNVKITGANSNDFALAPQNSNSGSQYPTINPCSSFGFGNSIQPGQSCTIPLTFTPAPPPLPGGSTRNATLTITDNAYPSKTQTVLLEGNASSGSVTASPVALTFPDTSVGSSATQSVLVTNGSSLAATVTSVTFGATSSYSVDAAQTLNACSSSKPLSAFTGSCVVYIKFSPKTGTNPDTATIHTSANSPTVTLSGNGVNPNVNATPTTLTFTSQAVGTQSSPQAVTLSNPTGTAVTISSTPSISGTNPGDFTLGTNSCTTGANVPATTGSCAVNVIFKPGAVGGTGRTATLSISDSPDATSPHLVSLSGTAIAPDVTVAKSHSGNFFVGQTGTYTVTVTNTGTEATTGTTTATDTLPTGLTFNSNTNTGVWSCAAASQTVTCTSSTAIAASGGMSAFNLVVNVAAAAAGTPTNSVSVTTAGDIGTTGKTATDPTTVTFPLPTITSLSPTSATAGAAGFTLTVNGTNYVSGSVVNFNGTATTTTFVSATQLTASITAAEIATAGTFNVTVTNPAPGGGISVSSPFTVNNPTPTVTILSPSSGTVGGAAFTLTVNGTNFNHSSVVTFNGSVRTTTFVSTTQLTIQVTTGDIATLGSLPLLVTNPAPGGGTSATVNLPVTNPPPVITTIAPTSATAGGAGFTLTVNGTGFVTGATVSFNGIDRTTTFVNSTQATAAILASDIATAGTFNVTVKNPAPGGGTSGNSSFTVNNPLPTLTSLSPTSTLAGGASFTLTVNGTNFNSSSVVNFNGTARTTTFVTSTQVTILVGAPDIATAGTFNVTVANPAPGGGTSATSPFTVNNPAPAITSLSPNTATKGGLAFTLTVNGTGFVANSSVKFNGTARTTTFVNATQITAAITAADIAAAGSFNVTVTNSAPGGGTSGNSPFTVNNPLPAITSLSPASATAGGAAFTLTVNGTGFVNGATVSFNGNNKTTTFVSATQVTAAITPADIATAGSFNVVVTNPAPGGGASGNSPFAVNNPLPTITTLSPTSAIVGGAAFTLTVNGTKFVSGSVVNFNGNPKTTTFVSATQITAAITVGDLLTAGSINVTVTNPNPGGGASGNSPFAINNPAPTITSLSPNGATAGGAGFTLTVNGTGFLSTSVVKFNSTAKTTTFVSATQLTASILSSDISAVGSANVTVTNPAPGGGTTPNFVFTIASQPNPVPTLTSISPTSGVAGQSVNMTLTGTGFIAGSIVNFGGNGDTGGTASNGGTTITITIPAGQLSVGGPLNVTVTNPSPGGGTSAAQTFTINNPAPAITTISPTSATVGGAGFTLTVNGTGFVSSSVVNFNGAAKTTTFVSATQLTAAISPADIAVVANFPVTVTNPTPGGGTSASSTFAVNNPAPAVTTLSPTSATAGGPAFSLTVNGTGFVVGSVVNFNSSPRTTTFVNATQLTAAITVADIATAGTLSVTVTNATPGGGISAISSFTVNNPLPAITSLSPTNALAGGTAFTLTVNGSNFNSSSVVNFNGTAATTTFVSASQITAAITAAEIATAGSFNVTVTNPAPGGGTSANSAFAVNNPVPTIASLSPTTTSAGGAAFTLTVNGTNFVASSVVNFNGTAKTTTFVSATKVTASITAADIAAAGTFNVTVTNPAPGGGISANSPFAVNNPVPTIASLSPASAVKGGATFTLTVNGTNFVSTSVVNFSGSPKTTTFVSATQLTASIAAADIASAGTLNVTVTNPTPGGGTSANSPFAVNNPVPAITSLSPTSATVGGAAFTLTVNGTGFLSGAAVTFNGNSRVTTFVSATQITAAITVADIATAGTFNVTVTNPAPTAGPSAAQTFSVNNPLPAITSLSPTTATAGGAAFTLTVNGTNFVSSSAVNFNGTAATTTFVNSTQVTASITAAQIATAGTFNVTVMNPAPGGGTSGNSPFTVNNPLPTLVSLSPTSASKGAAFTLTVTGTNFNSSSVLNFNGTAKTTTFLSATQVKASITATDTATSGTINVTVTNPAPGGGTSSTQPFQIVAITATQDQSTPGTITVNAGTPALVKIDFTTTPASSPLPSALTVACTVPQSLTGATCSASPSSIPANTASASSTITINAIPTTKAAGMAISAPNMKSGGPWSTYLLWLVAAAILSMLGMSAAVRQRALLLRRAPAYLALVLLVLAAGALVGCTTMSGPTPTPTGPSTVTVTATTADGASVSTTVNIIISN